MIYILILLLLAMWAAAYRINRGNLISAWIISISMYIFVSAVYIAALDYFDRDITAVTVKVVITALIFFGAGEIIGRKIPRLTLRDPLKERRIKGRVWLGLPLEMTSSEIVIFTLICVGVTLFKMKALMGISGSSSLRGIFTAAREAAVTGSVSYGILINQLSVLSECLAYYCSLAFFYNWIILKSRKLRLLLPVVAYFMLLICSTGRVGIIELITVMCVCGFSLYLKKNKWNPKISNKKIILITLFAIILFIAIFRITGLLTGRTQKYSFFRNISGYTAASLFGLDIVLRSETVISDTPRLFGQSVFRNIYVLLREWGFDIPQIPPFDTFYFWVGGSSNIYTGLYKVLMDFGFTGLYLTRFLLGFIYARLAGYLRLKKEPSPILLIIAGKLIYPIVMTAIGDVFTGLFSTTILYELFYLLLIDYYYKRKLSACQESLPLKGRP
jgi:hypothetical protein